MYLHLQMRLEGLDVIRDLLIRQAEPVPGEEVPLILIAQMATERLAIYYDEDMPADLLQRVTCIEPDFPNVDGLVNVLNAQQISCEVGRCKTYIFPSQPANDTDVICFSKHDPKVKAFGFDDFAEKVYAVERNSLLVSACVSTRENEKCGEAWVYTIPSFRNQGFAQKVVNAWARDLMIAGKVPFYSHIIANMASASVARRLGLQSIFEEMCIMRA